MLLEPVPETMVHGLWNYSAIPLLLGRKADGFSGYYKYAGKDARLESDNWMSNSSSAMPNCNPGQITETLLPLESSSLNEIIRLKEYKSALKPIKCTNIKHETTQVMSLRTILDTVFTPKLEQWVQRFESFLSFNMQKKVNYFATSTALGFIVSIKQLQHQLRISTDYYLPFSFL